MSREENPPRRWKRPGGPMKSKTFGGLNSTSPSVARIARDHPSSFARTGGGGP